MDIFYLVSEALHRTMLYNADIDVFSTSPRLYIYSEWEVCTVGAEGGFSALGQVPMLIMEQLDRHSSHWHCRRTRQICFELSLEECS